MDRGASDPGGVSCRLIDRRLLSRGGKEMAGVPDGDMRATMSRVRGSSLTFFTLTQVVASASLVQMPSRPMHK